MPHVLFHPSAADLALDASNLCTVGGFFRERVRTVSNTLSHVESAFEISFHRGYYDSASVVLILFSLASRTWDQTSSCHVWSDKRPHCVCVSRSLFQRVLSLISFFKLHNAKTRHVLTYRDHSCVPVRNRTNSIFQLVSWQNGRAQIHPCRLRQNKAFMGISHNSIE